MKLKIEDLQIEPVRVGNRIEFNFVAPDNLEYVTLEKSGFYGDLHLKEIQLEQSTTATSFVEPMESETVESGLFKSVRGIEYEITSPDSDTWAEIRQTVDGSITTYHNGTLQSTMAHTVEDIIFGIADIAGNDEASFNLRLDGIQQTVKDAMYKSVQTQLSDFVGIQLEDMEGNYNHILNTVDAHTQTIGSDGGNLAQKVMNDRLFQLNITDEIEDAKSSYTQLSDMIGLRVEGVGQIVIGGHGITIDSESVYIGKSTQIGDGIITNKMVSANAEFDGAKIAEGTIGSAKIAFLDVSKISGNIANFIRANFNDVNSNTSIDGSGLKISTTQSWDLRLGNSGVAVIDRLGRETGAFRATLDENGNPEGAFTVVEPGYIGGLARRRADGSGLLTGEVFINGSTGAFTVRPFTTFHESISMQDEKLLSMGPQGEIVSRGADLNRSTYERHQFYTTRAGNRRGLSVQWDQVMFGRNINMDGYQINNQSDIRLKKNIEPSNLNALREIERLEFIEFEWKKDMVANENKPDGRHFGIKAQYSPFLQTKLESEDSYLSVDMIKQVNLNSKASQELLAYTRSLEKRIEVLENGETA